MSVVIYHNPRCSKSRQTLELVKQNATDVDIVEYLKTPPTVETLQHIVSLLGQPVRSILRNKEAEYKEAGLDDKTLNDEQIIELMVQFPKVIERPIVVANNKAAVGRPPENVLEIL